MTNFQKTRHILTVTAIVALIFLGAFGVFYGAGLLGNVAWEWIVEQSQTWISTHHERAIREDKQPCGASRSRRTATATSEPRLSSSKN